MVIREDRARLHKALSDLITGRITTWEFDKIYFELECSPDRGVAEICRFGWGLYSDGFPYRLTVHYRIDAGNLIIAKRCLLFLETDLEYSWPDFPSLSWQGFTGGLAFSLFPVAIALIIVSLILLAVALGHWKDFIYFWLCGVPGFLLLASCIWFWRWSNRRDSPAWRKFWASGDQDAWPFLTRAEYIGVVRLDPVAYDRRS
jgi:hypothetical protein